MAGAKDKNPKAQDAEKPEAEAAEGEAPAKKGFAIPKLALYGGAGAGIVLIGAVAAFFVFSGGEEASHAGADGHGGAESHAAAAQAGPSVFVDLPEMVVNLSSTGAQTSYLKLRVSLELPGEEAAKAIHAATPKVVDQFQLFLRELRIEDLQGSAGTFRLKEELLRRVNAAVEPVKVRDVLFKEMLIQ